MKNYTMTFNDLIQFADMTIENYMIRSKESEQRSKNEQIKKMWAQAYKKWESRSEEIHILAKSLNTALYDPISDHITYSAKIFH